MKQKLGAKLFLYPLPIVLVGAMTDNRPNYMAAAHVGIIDFQSICVSLGKNHHTNKGIVDQEAFSINVPGKDMVKLVDYCGTVSGKAIDKAKYFSNFFGAKTGVPMIEQFPLTMEIRLSDVLDRPGHDVFIGEVVETYCDESYLTEGTPDISKISPLLFSMTDKGYYETGNRIGTAWKTATESKKS